MLLAPLAVLVTSLTSQDPDLPPALLPGEPLEGVVTDDAPVVRMPTLDASYAEIPTVGVEYRLVVEQSGAYRVDLRSYDFDAYLVLRDGEGALLAEDDDGLIATHARLVVTLETGTEYRLLACALHGKRGDHRLELVPGAPAPMSAAERAQLAIEDGRAALAHAEATHGPDHLLVANASNALAALLYSTGAFAEARPLLERASGIVEAHWGPEHPETAAMLNNLARLLKAMGAYSDARPLYERALAIQEAELGDDHLHTATSLNNLAVLLLDTGAYAEAKPLAERALAIRMAQLGPEHPRTATSLNTLGLLLHAMGLHAEARSHLEQALEIHMARLGPAHPETATTMTNLAGVLEATGALAEARLLHEEALAVFEAQLGPEHSLTAASLNNLGILLTKAGEHAEALAYLERALAIEESRLGPAHLETAKSLHNLAGVLGAMGAYAEARSAYERAAAIWEARLGPRHPHVALCLNNLATLLLDLREPAEAWQLFRRWQAGTRAHLDGHLAARTRAEGQQYLSRLREMQEALLSIPWSHPEPEILAGAASSLFAWKGQVGRVALAVRRLARESGEARALSARLGERQRELSRLAYDPAPDARARERRLAEVRAEIEALNVALRELVEVGELDALDASSLRERMPADAALLGFFVQHLYEPARYEGEEVVDLGRWSEEHLVAWIVRPDAEVVSVDLGLAAPLEAKTRAFLDSLVEVRGVPVEGRREPPGDALRAALWDPLLEALGDASLVIVSHDRFTATLPFEVLPDVDGRYLVEQRSFVYLHDLQAIGGLEPEVSREYGSLLCAGDVDFNLRDEPEVPASAGLRGEADAPTERWQFWAPLERTRSEVTTIRALHEAFVPEGTRTVVTGADATEERVVAELPAASLVHLATHGYFRPEGLPSMWQAALELAEEERERGGGQRIGDGLLGGDRMLTGYLPEVLSGLVFAGANLEREEGRLDGYLTAADVEWLDLSGVELITLSACETGLGRSASGEGMSGFQTTLLRAGAKTVVTSLWQVPDDSTERLMGRFYENLLRHGMGKLEALREAQLWMLRENRRKYDGDGRPSTWGAFVLGGDWR